jgi:hypothetical protein
MDITFRDFLSFEKMLATRIIRVVYLIGLVAAAIIGLIALVGSLIALFSGNIGNGLAGIVVTVVGVVIWLLVWRLSCEVWIVMFGIYDRLGEIKANTTPR